MKKIIIFGAGITGLAAGKWLVQNGYDVTVVEQDGHVGGLASTFHDSDGFIYDNGPRFIFSTLAKKLGIDHLCKPVKYIENICINKTFYVFPFGLIRRLDYAASIAFAMLTRLLKSKPNNLGEFLELYYGSHFSNSVLKPLIEKWSGVPSSQMSIDFASRLLPTNLSYIIYSLIKKLRGGITEDYYKGGRFIVYPKGSNSQIFDALLSDSRLKVKLNCQLQNIDIDQNKITFIKAGNEKYVADYFLSTVPIHLLPTMMDNSKSLETYKRFIYRSIAILFIKLNKEKVMDCLWSWFPQSVYSFYRISEYKNVLNHFAPKGKTLISVEFAFDENDQLQYLNANDLYNRIEKNLYELYKIEKKDILGLDVKLSLHAYPVLKKDTEELQRSLTHQTPFDNLFIAGRTGMFQYRMTEGCFDLAISCANQIMARDKGQIMQHQNQIERDAYGRPNVVHE